MALNVSTGLDGWFGTTLVAALVFGVIQSVWSFAVEGRRHAVDRLATTLVYSTFVIAVVPLISVLFTVLVKGLKVMSWSFLTNSMRNVSPRNPGGGAGHAIVGTLEQVAHRCGLRACLSGSSPRSSWSSTAGVGWPGRSPSSSTS